MPLSSADREHVVETVLDLLRHRDRKRLLKILEQRLADGDYPDAGEQELDRIACALARAIDAQLGDAGT